MKNLTIAIFSIIISGISLGYVSPHVKEEPNNKEILRQHIYEIVEYIHEDEFNGNINCINEVSPIYLDKLSDIEETLNKL